jgi:hypothetical protein
MHRYLAAQVELEAVSMRMFAELVANLIAFDAQSRAELAWEIQRWLFDALSADERAEVTAAMTTTQNALWVDGPAARILLAALARRTGV